MIDADRNLTVVGEDRVDGCAREPKDLGWGCPGAPGLELGAMLQTVHLAPDRYALYRKHLAAIGGDRAARRDSGVTVGLYRAGIATSGAGKNVVWAPTPPAPVVADTESRSPGRPHRQLRGAVGRLVHRALERLGPCAEALSGSETRYLRLRRRP